MNNFKLKSATDCRIVGAIILALLISGCATDRYHFTDDASLERQSAVRNIMAQQILDKRASERNAGRMPEAEDGQRAVNTLQDYRGEGSTSGSGSSGASGSDTSGLTEVLKGLQGLL